MAGRNAHSSSSIPPQAVAASKQGKGLRNDLVKMVYGYGDEKQPMQESVDLLDDLVKEYLEEMCRQACEVARLGRRDVQTSDFIFLIRKDGRRYKRMKDLLEADEELRDARDPKVKKMTET
ncbi:transcription initiation factor tfiid subunit 13 [Nannochloropsis gaditana]|uniref:Transcription initiation factor TFIID subunit 13 n=1 Tax=Nannochloropsis gaditana TaxID=72520 RepID=W7TPD9_9STRA|nr:transcription initiation factor tfiid subunit 13 [Nannochloropsis gaditana]